MMVPPPYFERIRDRAASRWVQLEKDPELAGPWHQLFKQVQSPRHIVSELLQNADDAGATEATVCVDEHCFVFTHNGEDFSEEHFASLCRFGYSNKRALHTIGFRGIGFKSTFSLGDVVELRTSSLSVIFHAKRFTEPEWVGEPRTASGSTEIRVAISDSHREREVEKNLQEWRKNPVSLLFFKNIRRLKIADKDIYWGSLGPGPVPGTEWMAMHDAPDRTFLVARDAPEAFPAEALDEIKRERMLAAEQEAEFPPCKVEIVLGAKGQLYVVLPTGVETKLPFACNAPFIQDPARLKIKDPETSPTNRWLLERTGKFAASVMLQWLGQNSATVADRSQAYGFFPDVDRDDSSLEGMCASCVETAFEDALGESPFLLTDEGDLRHPKQSVIFPEELFEVWKPDQVAAFFDSENRPALSLDISPRDIGKLVNWGVVEKIEKGGVFAALQSKRLPKPQEWMKLLKLWAYLAPKITDYRNIETLDRSKIRIVPVQGKDDLYAPAEIVRLGEKRLLQSEDDWNFLSEHLLVMNQNWPRFIGEKRREAEDANDKKLMQYADASLAVMKNLGLDESSDTSKIMEKVANNFFVGPSKSLAEYVRIAQISAKIDAKTGFGFGFVTRDSTLKLGVHDVIFDSSGSVIDLLPEAWCENHVLHQEYSSRFSSCTVEEWTRWVSSGRSGLRGFVRLDPKHEYIWGDSNAEKEIVRRGEKSGLKKSYNYPSYRMEDWDYKESYWNYWENIARDDATTWGKILETIASDPVSSGTKIKFAQLINIARNGSERTIHRDLLPSWILKFRELPCLPDLKGTYRKPADLLRRTPETESLIDIEPFLHSRLDVEANRPLLAALGVREKPTGPERLLDCLRALAKSERPPVVEVDKWYRRLDQMVDSCSTEHFAKIQKAFQEERVVLTEDGCWSTGRGVFLSASDDDVPGAPVIRAAVRDLAFWRKVGIAERPTADLAIQWLNSLPSGNQLNQEDAKRVRALLPRYPIRIWNECGHWLNIAREWMPTDSLEHSLTMLSLVEWSHLHDWVKKKTADFRSLSSEIAKEQPFVGLTRLADHIEDRFHRSPTAECPPETKPWMTQLGIELSRAKFDDEVETLRIRERSAELAKTTWVATPTLEVIPYIGGVPAGTARRSDVVWLSRVLYVDARLSTAKLARLVPERLGAGFGRTEVTAALNYCFGRSAEDVTEYLEENFDLVLREEVPSTEDVVAEVGGASEVRAQTERAPAPLLPADCSVGDIDDPDSADLSPVDVDEDVRNDRSVLPPKTPSPAPTALHRPDIIERFARKHGFRKSGGDRFEHTDGSWIAKVSGESFPWERRTASGELLRRYLPKEHCLERKPLQIDASEWMLIDQFPEEYALVISDIHDAPVEATGAELRQKVQNGELKLFPATYRLVLAEQ